MKKQLLDIFEVMKRIETKGESTVFMADCLKALADIINSMPEESEKTNE